MPESPLETQELKEKLEEATERLEEAAEHVEHAEGAHHEEKKAPWILHLSLSTALIAVFAAIAALEAGAFANDAIVQKNESVLQQSQANDEWAYYQSKGIKAIVYMTAAEQAAASNEELAKKFREESKREKGEQAESMSKAKEREAEVKKANEESEHSLHRHHQFAKSVTIFQVAIALAAIAALTRRKPLWWVSMVVGLGGVWFFLHGFGVFGL